MGLTFGLTVIAWIFFRAENIGHAWAYLNGIFSFSIFRIPYYEGIGYAKFLFPLLLIFIFTEWLGRRNQFALEKVLIQSRIIKWSIYIIILGSIFYYGGTKQEFIYFQF